MSVSKEEYQKRRFQACLNALPRSLNTNINPGFMLPRRGFAPAIWTGGDAPVAGPVTSEYLSRYQFRVTPINKDMHLKKDEIKLYVERALQLGDERKGMPVVSSPIWAPAK